MRATSLLSKLMNLNHIRFKGVEFEWDRVVIDVGPSWRTPRCSGCGKKAQRVYDCYKGRTWRHLDLCGTIAELRYDTRRVNCGRCGVRVEKVPWAQTSSNFTYPFEEHVTYLAQRLSATAVSELMRMSWRTVGDIVHRVVARLERDDPLDALTHIGVDELSYRKHHKYITIVTDHLRGCVIWVGEGKNADALGAFFDELGDERCAKLQVVTLDMSAAYIKAVREAAPQAELIFDRFHVQRLVHDALDEVRREQVREATEPEEKCTVKGTRWSLQKNPWNLNHCEKAKLSVLQKSNKPLYRAYLLKESILATLDGRWFCPKLKLEEWLQWAARSRLGPFVKLGRTIRKYSDGILAYVRSGLSNARNEGINSKIRTVTRRAYGFHSASSLISYIILCCSGIHLEPAFNYPFAYH